MTLEPPWGRRLVHLEGPCPEGPLTFDLQIEAAVHGSPLGWIVGPWARDVECGRTDVGALHVS